MTPTPSTPNNEQKMPSNNEALDKIFPCDCSFILGFSHKAGEPCKGSCTLAPYKRQVEQYLKALNRQLLEAILEGIVDFKPHRNKTFSNMLRRRIHNGYEYTDEDTSYIINRENESHRAHIKKLLGEQE